jgi:hypothetical protein
VAMTRPPSPKGRNLPAIRRRRRAYLSPLLQYLASYRPRAVTGVDNFACGSRESATRERQATNKLVTPGPPFCLTVRVTRDAGAWSLELEERHGGMQYRRYCATTFFGWRPVKWFPGACGVFLVVFFQSITHCRTRELRETSTITTVQAPTGPGFWNGTGATHPSWCREPLLNIVHTTFWTPRPKKFLAATNISTTATRSTAASTVDEAGARTAPSSRAPGGLGCGGESEQA